MKHSWAMFLLGVWICGSICTSVVATQNFYTVDRLLSGSPSDAFHAAVARLGPAEGRDLLRYLSSELNRLYFQLWNYAQLVVGGAVLWLLWGTRSPVGPRRIVIAMFAIAVLMTVWLQPAITTLGRSLDFVPRDPPPPGMSRFWVLHGTYTTLEMLKLLAGLTAAWWLARSGAAAQAGPPRRAEQL
jgi:hypothetical protein